MISTTIQSVRFLAAIGAMSMLFGACKKDDAGAAEQGQAQPAVAQGHADEAQPSLSAESRTRIGEMLAAYEQVRATLSRDEVTAVTDDAAAVQRAATAAAEQAPTGLRTHLTNMSAAAGRLKDMAKDDADAVRHAFGDLSRATVALLAAEPSLQQGHHVFECPMAQGYKKWVQVSAEVSNPYMGTRMPECGAGSQWRE